jgi:DNA repair protein RecN (Recombination protein N)
VLERIRIRDLALVEAGEVEFGPGLNVVTGETGAGKSLLVQAISLLVGERAESDVVREGASAAVVEGEFRLTGELATRVSELLSSWSLEFDGECVIVRREVNASGRSRASVNQSPVTQSALKRLGEILADLHGQHEHQSLLKPDAGIELLDRLAGLAAERAAHAERLAAYREAAGEHERLEQSLASYAERRDYLMQAVQELDDAALEPGEDDALRIEAARLQHADRLGQVGAQALERLAEGENAASDSIAAAARACEQAAALDPSLAGAQSVLEEAYIAATEAARQLSAYAASLEGDPRALEGIEARRDLISRLTRKYRRGIGELIAWRIELAAELAEGEDSEGAHRRSRERLDRAAEACRLAAEELSRRRRAAAPQWSDRVSRDLKPLGLPAARLEFSVEAAAGESSSRTGLASADEVSIQFTANPGEALRPLQKIASGGELSRVMLALKTALEVQDRVDVLLFDEVDSGIGGTVARAVGERLRRLARHRQVLCITHLPMIAALASHHIGVAKTGASGRTVAGFQVMRGEARVAELARMLAGDRASNTTLRQARELLDASGTPARP